MKRSGIIISLLIYVSALPLCLLDKIKAIESLSTLLIVWYCALGLVSVFLGQDKCLQRLVIYINRKGQNKPKNVQNYANILLRFLLTCLNTKTPYPRI